MGEYTYYWYIPETENYYEKRGIFTIRIIEVSLSSISVKAMPTKVEYYKGDTLNTEGLVLTGINNNGSTFEITEGYTYSPTKLNTVGTQEIEVTYEGKKTTFNVIVKDIEISSDKYEVEEIYISDIQKNTSVSKFIKNISVNGINVKIKDKNGEEITDKGLITTGSKLILNDEKEYILVATGDVTGDGKIDIQDLFAINNHRLSKQQNLLKDEYFMAGDITGDGKVDVIDMLMANNLRLM